MRKQLFFTVVIIFFTIIILKAQKTELIVAGDIKLPKDSIESSQLLANLNDFLIEASKGNEENIWVLSSDKLNTSIILTELKQINSNRQNDQILKPHLDNVTPIGSGQYMIQLSYIELAHSTPHLIALFEIVATKYNNSFRFSSPLTLNTRNWETMTDEYLTFYYNSDNANLCNQYIRYIKQFDKMLGNNPAPEMLYFCNDCDNLSQLLRLLGVLFHIDYNGLTWSMVDFYTTEGILKLYTSRMSKVKNVDPHDIFHGRSSLDIPYEQKNRLMICGSAYVYAGSWGYSWSEIQKIFKTNIKYDNKTDWLKLYFDKYNFGNDLAKKLFVTQFVNALIVQKVEKEKGFSVVKELLASGSMYKDKEGFFEILEKVAEINEVNFNKKVGKLINEAMKSI